jgi:hypothetical protein
MKKRSTNLKKQQTEEIKYCTECGEELNDYCFSDDVNDLEKLKEHHENCKTTKKFKGDVCSRLFIAAPVETNISKHK